MEDLVDEELLQRIGNYIVGVAKGVCHTWVGLSEMNKFNLPRRNIQKERRAKRAEKRKLRSSAATLKVSSTKTPSRISGKKARKLQKRWRQVGDVD